MRLDRLHLGASFVVRYGEAPEMLWLSPMGDMRLSHTDLLRLPAGWSQ